MRGLRSRCIPIHALPNLHQPLKLFIGPIVCGSPMVLIQSHQLLQLLRGPFLQQLGSKARLKFGELGWLPPTSERRLWTLLEPQIQFWSANA